MEIGRAYRDEETPVTMSGNVVRPPLLSSAPYDATATTSAQPITPEDAAYTLGHATRAETFAHAADGHGSTDSWFSESQGVMAKSFGTLEANSLDPIDLTDNANEDPPVRRQPTQETSEADLQAIRDAEREGMSRPRRSTRAISYAPYCKPDGTEIKSKGSQVSGRTASVARVRSLSSSPAVRGSTEVDVIVDKRVRKGRMPVTRNDVPHAPLLRQPSASGHDNVDDRSPHAKIVEHDGQDADAVRATKRARSIAPRSPTDKSESQQGQEADVADGESTEDYPTPSVQSVESGTESEEGEHGAEVRKGMPEQHGVLRETVVNSNESSKKVTETSKVSAGFSRSSSASEEGTSNSTTRHSLRGPIHGKPLSLVVGATGSAGRHPGLGKKRRIPSLHPNPIKPTTRDSKPIVFDLRGHSATDGGQDGWDDDDDETNGKADRFRRRPGESEQQFLLRLCDEEGPGFEGGDETYVRAEQDESTEGKVYDDE